MHRIFLKTQTILWNVKNKVIEVRNLMFITNYEQAQNKGKSFVTAKFSSQEFKKQSKF